MEFIALIFYIYAFIQFVKMCGFLLTDSVAIRMHDKPYRDSESRMGRLGRSYKAFGKMILVWGATWINTALQHGYKVYNRNRENCTKQKGI